MNTKCVDIESLMSMNPSIILPKEYQNVLIDRIKTHFNEEEQKLFVTSFFCHVNHDDEDFVIKLNDTWKWLGYGRMEECKRVLVKNFEENKDYKIEFFAPPTCGAKTKPSKDDEKIKNEKKVGPCVGSEEEEENQEKEKNETRGGHNKETIFLTINCFKELCIVSKTEKAKRIHKYYIKMEKIVNLTVAEQVRDITERMRLKDQEINKIKNVAEEVILENVKNNKLVYLGTIDDGTTDILIKFGFTKEMLERILSHRKKIPGFMLRYTIVTEKYVQLEDMIKKGFNDKDSPLYGRRVSRTYNGKIQTEIIKLDKDFTLDDLYKHVLALKVDIETNKMEELTEIKKKYYNLQTKYDERGIEIEYLRKTIKNLNEENECTGYEYNNDDDELINGSDDEEVVDTLKLVKCTACSNKMTKEEFGTNPLTQRIYIQCPDCRKKYSDENFEKSREKREKKQEEESIKRKSILAIREELLNDDNTYICSNCKGAKTPREFGVNNINNELYRTCTVCRDKTKLKRFKNKDTENSKDAEDTNDKVECSKCHDKFKTEYNKITKSMFKTCGNCREKYQNVLKKSKESMLKNDGEDAMCIYCKNNMKKTLNAHGDGYYKSCQECRDSRKSHDKKKYTDNKEEILEEKKKYYNKNREDIRIKQKEHYDKNKDQ